MSYSGSTTAFVNLRGTALSSLSFLRVKLYRKPPRDMARNGAPLDWRYTLACLTFTDTIVYIVYVIFSLTASLHLILLSGHAAASLRAERNAAGSCHPPCQNVDDDVYDADLYPHPQDRTEKHYAGTGYWAATVKSKSNTRLRRS